MISQKNIRLTGINADDTLQLLGEGDYLNLLNGRIGISQDGKNQRIETIRGTTALVNNVYPPYGTNICIGSCVDVEGQRLVWFIYNTFNDNGIYVYDLRAKEIYAVIYDSQVTGGLGFDKNYRIDRNCKVINGVLYWTDNNNEPKKINLDKGIKANQSGYVTTATPYSLPLAYTTITIIRRPPYYNLTATKNYDAGFTTNFIASSAFQMCAYYGYIDNEISRLGAFSTLLNYNLTAETNNYIVITLPFAEYIDDDVQVVNFCAKNLDTNATTIIKIFDKNNAADLAAINAHNAGSVQLTFNFYNNVSGQTLFTEQATIPFDSVPLKTKTLETAINRLMLGNNLSGYNTPTTTSLQLTQNFSSGGTYPANFFTGGSSWNVSIEFLDRFRRKCSVVNLAVTTSTAEVLYTGAAVSNMVQTLTWALSNTNAQVEIPDWAYFYQLLITKNQTKQSFLECLYNNCCYVVKNIDGSLDFTQTVYDSSKTYAIGIDISNLTAAGLGYTFNEGDIAVVHLNTTTNYTLNVIGQQGNYVLLQSKNIGSITNSFKWDFLPLAVVDHVTYTLPTNLQNNYNQTGFAVQSTQFADLGAPALDNPNWAIQVYPSSTVYTFNIAGNISLKPTNTYPSDYMQVTVVMAGFGNPDILIDLATQNGVIAGTTYNLSWNQNITIPAGYTKFILIYRSSRGEIKPAITGGYNTASRATDLNVIDIYTPYKSASQYEPYYECTPVYAINNPATNSRQYSTLTGTIQGDLYSVTRHILYSTTTYGNAAMSPNDLYWKLWNRNLGWVNYITLLGQTRNEHEIRFSLTYTTGTANNGLSTFSALDFKTVPLGIGTIQKLQLASKTEEQGVIMLAIGSFQTVSCYLGEVQLVGASKNSALIQDTSVIGTMNVLKGMFGTTAPETVVEYLGLVFWYDLNNGAIVQYSTNGLEAVSHYKMASFFQKYAKAYLNANQSDLDLINGFHHIPTSINPFTKRLEITLPALIYPNYAATLPSYSSVPSYASSIINWFDPYTELAQTVCFDIIGNRWKETMQYVPEWTDFFENTVFAWKNGAIYTLETNSSTWNTFFGVQYPLRFCFTPNMPLSAIKDVFGIAIEGDTIPDFSVLLSDYPNTQITDLASPDYENVEGVQYAYWLRDRLSPNSSGTADQKLYTGDVIKGATVKILIEFQQYNGIISINFVNILFAESYGQKGLLQK